MKSADGYIVLPGSTIRGKEYTWYNDRPLAPAPDWLQARCKVPKAKLAGAATRIAEETEVEVKLAQTWLAGYDAVLDEVKQEQGRLSASRPRSTTLGFMTRRVLGFLTDTGTWQGIVSRPSINRRSRLLQNSARTSRQKAIEIVPAPNAKVFEPATIDETKVPPETAVPALRKAKFYAVSAADGARQALELRGEPLIDGILDRGTMSVLVGSTRTAEKDVPGARLGVPHLPKG